SDEDAAHFEAVKAALEAVGIAYEVDPYIVRGLDYYSRTVWEFEPQSTGGQSTVGAGGRYDGLMELLGGQPTPGVGFATGIERIAMNLRERGLWDTDTTDGPELYLAVVDEVGLPTAHRLARNLRNAGASVVIGDARRSLKAQLRNANQIVAKAAVVVGRNEVSAGVIEMRSYGEQIDLSSVPAIPLDSPAVGMLVLWNAVEMALRDAYIGRLGFGSDPDPQQVIDRLIEAGQITREEAEMLRFVREARNRIAHAGSAQDLSATTEHEMAGYLRRVLPLLSQIRQARLSPPSA
ncbi:MAG: hypothetical protein DWG77_04280, partial [Chloroflexi bacterium]|nr:hypothetical protein [Chloroflexota bacterium]